MEPEPEFPQDAARRAWARALRHPGAPIEDHQDARVVALPGGVVVSVAIDEREEGEFARVSAGRPDGELSHDEAVPLVARVYLCGRFEPFPVEAVVGADGRTLHYAIDLEAYKDARALDHIARAARETGASTDGDPSHAEIAAIQLAVPLYRLARTWDLEKARRADDRALRYLSNRFLVPRRWIAFQMAHFFAELADGLIDERGIPSGRPDRE